MGLAFEKFTSVSAAVTTFKPKKIEVFGNVYSINLFTLRCRLPSHVCDGLGCITDLSILGASTFELFSYVIKSFVKMTSGWKSTTLEKTIQTINASKQSPISVVPAVRTRRARLAREEVNSTPAHCHETTCAVLPHFADNKKSFSVNVLLRFLKK